MVGIIRFCIQSRGPLRAIVGATLLLLLPAILQGAIYPTVLYSGINPIGISEPNGIASIEINTGSGWRRMRDGMRTPYFRVINAPSFSRCAKKASLSLYVERIDVPLSVRFRVTDCRGGRESYSLALENTWNLFHEDFGTVTTADRPCHTFMVQADGGEFVIDRVESPSNQFTIHYPFREPPITIVGRKTYRYSVCFTPTGVGRVKVPIYVHIRREQPVGRYTTYIVADTAYVNVVPSRSRPDPDPPPVIRQQPPPRPDPPRMPPGGPEIPPAPKPVLAVAEPVEGEPLVPERDEIVLRDPGPTPEVILPEYEEPIFDPTTFRRILSPSARGIGEGKGFLGSYDIAGLVAGYGVSDRLSLIAGGAWGPESLGDFGAGTFGAKYTVIDRGALHLAGGLQLNLTSSPTSDIYSVAPYVVVDIGTLDYGIGGTLSYTWRRHLPSDSAIPPFERPALLVGIGGDYRFARHWKVAGEAFLIGGSEFQPAALSLRWFNDRLAIDGGVTVDLVPDAQLRVFPLISGVWTF